MRTSTSNLVGVCLSAAILQLLGGRHTSADRGALLGYAMHADASRMNMHRAA